MVNPISSVASISSFPCRIPSSVTLMEEDVFFKSNPTVIVENGSYAMEYCIKNNIKYTFAEANDWLLS